MRILQVHPIMKTLHGSERLLIELTNRFIRDGNQVQICSLFIAEECKRNLSSSAKIMELGWSFGKEGFLATFMQYFGLPLVVLRAGTADVIIAHAYGSMFASALMKKVKKSNIVYLCHEPPRFAYDLKAKTEANLSLVKRWMFKIFLPLFRGVDLWAAQKADVIVALSMYSQGQIEAIYGRETILAQPGVDLGKFKPESGIRLRKKLGIDSKEIVLLSVGKLHVRKNFELQMRVLEKLLKDFPFLRLVIVGEGPHKQSLLTLAGELGISDHLVLTGFVDDQSLPEYYSLSDIFVFTAYDEPFGLVVLEAMAAGKPVVVPDSGGPSEIAVDSETGFLHKQGDDDLYAKVRLLIENPAMRMEMGEKAKKRAEKFSWENYYQKILEVL